MSAQTLTLVSCIGVEWRDFILRHTALDCWVEDIIESFGTWVYYHRRAAFGCSRSGRQLKYAVGSLSSIRLVTFVGSTPKCWSSVHGCAIWHARL